MMPICAGPRWAKGNPVPIPEPGSGTDTSRAPLLEMLVGVTQKDPETPSGDRGRVFFSA